MKVVCCLTSLHSVKGGPIPFGQAYTWNFELTYRWLPALVDEIFKWRTIIFNQIILLLLLLSADTFSYKWSTCDLYINQQDAQQILVIRLYFPLDALHVSDYISPSSGATFISCTWHLLYAGTIRGYSRRTARRMVLANMQVFWVAIQCQLANIYWHFARGTVPLSSGSNSQRGLTPCFWRWRHSASPKY
jgi:hypothetical protein